MLVESTRDNFGLIVYVFTLPDGRKVGLTKAQIEILKEEIAEHDAERKRKRAVAGT
jgi:hypothetical protein